MSPDTPDELIRSGYQARRDKKTPQAKEIFSRAVALCREGSDPSALAASLAGLGQIERDLRNSRAATQYYGEAVELCRNLPDRLRLAHIVRHLADTLREDGSLEDARPHYEEALRIYREHAAVPRLCVASGRGWRNPGGEIVVAGSSQLVRRCKRTSGSDGERRRDRALDTK